MNSSNLLASTPCKVNKNTKNKSLAQPTGQQQQQQQAFSLPSFLESLPSLQSLFITEYQCLKQLLYKNCSQHRKASYFHRLMRVRRRAESLNWDELQQVVDSLSTETVSQSYANLHEMILAKIDDFRLLCSECLLASQILIALLEQTYFMPFALTTISMVSRILTISRNIVYGLLVSLHSPAFSSMSLLSPNTKTVLLALYTAFRKGSEVEIFNKCYYMELLAPINWTECFPDDDTKEVLQSAPRTKSGSHKRKLSSISSIMAPPQLALSDEEPALDSVTVTPPAKQSLLFSNVTLSQNVERPEKPVPTKASLLTTIVPAVSTFSLLMDASQQSKKKKMKKSRSKIT
jgi:hypothetical protein